MADDIKIEVNWREFDKAMRSVPHARYTNVRKRMFSHHSRFLNRFKRKMAAGGPNQVRNRSRALSRSFRTEVTGTDLDSLAVETFTAGALYARIQEEGGTIHAKAGGWLMIDFNRTKAGVARGDGRGPFRMVKQVTIPGNLNFIRTFRDLERDFAREINAAVDDALGDE